MYHYRYLGHVFVMATEPDGAMDIWLPVSSCSTEEGAVYYKGRNNRTSFVSACFHCSCSDSFDPSHIRCRRCLVLDNGLSRE